MADARWWIFVGRAQAVGAIACRIARLPAGARVAVVVEADAFPHALARVGGVEPWIVWCGAARGALAACAAQALRTLHVPPGRGRVVFHGTRREWAAARAAWLRRGGVQARCRMAARAVGRVAGRPVSGRTAGSTAGRSAGRSANRAAGRAAGRVTGRARAAPCARASSTA